MKILIVEDDAVIAAAIQKHIQTWGMEAVRVEDFSDVLAAFVREDPQLVLMDVALPFYNGYHWCRELRRVSQVPVLFLSSASDNMNIVMAMNMGADDFIAKPFDLQVLTAKIQAMLRRAYAFNLSGRLLEHRGVLLNSDDGTVTYQGKKLELTKNEHRILQELLQNHGKVISREKLMQRLWETDSFVDENTLNVNVARLRKKLTGLGIEDLIETRKGEGYCIL